MCVLKIITFRFTLNYNISFYNSLTFRFGGLIWKQKLNIFGRRIGATIILSSFRFPFKSVHYEVKLNGKPHTEYNALMKQKLDDLFQRYKYRKMNA